VLAAVDLRVTESVGEEEVVLQTIVIIVHHIGTEVTPWMLHGTESLAQVI
jgi:hypothetical protein